VCANSSKIHPLNCSEPKTVSKTRFDITGVSHQFDPQIVDLWAGVSGWRWG